MSQSQEKLALFIQREGAFLETGQRLPTVECLSFQAIWAPRAAGELVKYPVADSPEISSHPHFIQY